MPDQPELRRKGSAGKKRADVYLDSACDILPHSILYSQTGDEDQTWAPQQNKGKVAR